LVSKVQKLFVNIVDYVFLFGQQANWVRDHVWRVSCSLGHDSSMHHSWVWLCRSSMTTMMVWMDVLVWELGLQLVVFWKNTIWHVKRTIQHSAHRDARTQQRVDAK
jgi:hypothetical protein